MGPQSGWSGNGNDNIDIIKTINHDLNTIFIQSLETRSEYEPTVTGSVSQVDLTKLLDDVHNTTDVEQQFYDYQESLDLDPRHYMIWARVMTTSNGVHITGDPKVTIHLTVTIFRTCDECGVFGNYTRHVLNVTRTALGGKPIDAYKTATTQAINSDEFQTKLRNELITATR